MMLSALSTVIPFYGQAQELEAKAVDCTQLEFGSPIEGVLTKEELILEMEQQLFSSVDRYSSCMDKAQTSASESAGTGGSGNEIEGEGSDVAESSSGHKPNDNSESEDKLAGAPDSGKIPLNNGAENKIVAPKDNDSIICKILYEEIVNEKNAEDRSDLNVEYQKYNCG